MLRIKRINTDQIGANRQHSRSVPASFLLLIAIGPVIAPLTGCRNAPDSSGTSAPRKNTDRTSSGLDAGTIIERYRALDNSRDSIIKIRASISGEQSGELNAPRQVLLTMYRQREPDGRLLILIEFTAPAEERDRDGLITVLPDGRIEAIRYVQIADNFIVTNDPSNEDALFGLTPQELAEGQPEKYAFTLVDEETYEGASVYRLDGKLKQGAESKFSRVVLFISEQNFAALQAEFYDNHNELVRRLTVKGSEQIAGHWTRTRWTIENRARQRRIDFEAVDVKYDQNLSDSIFTREHLKRIASR